VIAEIVIADIPFGEEGRRFSFMPHRLKAGCDPAGTKIPGIRKFLAEDGASQGDAVLGTK